MAPGLDRTRIQQRAEEAGADRAWARGLSDGELFQLILQPGLLHRAGGHPASPARGPSVWTVVRRAIDALRGNIDIASQPRPGHPRSPCACRSPLAIIDGLLVRVGDGRYVHPALRHRGMRRADRRPMTTALRRGPHLPQYPRQAWWPFPAAPRGVRHPHARRNQFQKVVIVSAGDQRVGLVVDQVIGDHQTVIKSLSKLHADVGAFSGATIPG